MPRAPVSLPKALRALVPCLLALSVLGASVPAFAQDFVISSGTKGGYYHSVGSRLATLLLRERFEAVHLDSVGSLRNLELLADAESPVNVGLAQADALRYTLDEHPALASQLVVLDDLGRECVALITSAEGGIASAADLKSGQAGRLALAGPGSGAAVTLEFMSRMEPDFRKTRVVHRDPLEAMLQMRMPGASGIAAVMLVKRPRILSPELEVVLGNRDRFRIAPIRPGDVRNGRLPDGSPVYSFDRVTTGAGIDYAVSFDTMCTRALLIASSAKLGEARRRDLAGVLLRYGKLIAPGR